MRCLLALILAFSLAQIGNAHANPKTLWDVFGGIFEEKPDEGPDPGQTLQAPFSYDPAREVNLEQTLFDQENSVPLHQPHRTSREIGEWLELSVSELMEFDTASYKDELNQHRNYFKTGGFGQYKQFLDKNGIMRVLESGRFNMRGFVKNKPILLNEGSIQGNYRWVYEVPVIVSYMDAADFDYKEKTPVSQEMKLTVQVGRVDAKSGNNNRHSVLIELWSGDVKTLNKPNN